MISTDLGVNLWVLLRFGSVCYSNELRHCVLGLVCGIEDPKLESKRTLGFLPPGSIH